MIITLGNEDYDVDALIHELEALTVTVDLIKRQVNDWRSNQMVKLDFIKNNNILEKQLIEKRPVIENKIKALNEKWNGKPNKTNEECSAIATLNELFHDFNNHSLCIYSDLYHMRYQIRGVILALFIFVTPMIFCSLVAININLILKEVI